MGLRETWLSPSGLCSLFNISLSYPPYPQPLATGSGSRAGILLVLITFRPSSLPFLKKLYLGISCHEITYNSPHLTAADIYQIQDISPCFLKTWAHGLFSATLLFYSCSCSAFTQLSLAYSFFPVCLLFPLLWLIITSILLTLLSSHQLLFYFSAHIYREILGICSLHCLLFHSPHSTLLNPTNGHQRNCSPHVYEGLWLLLNAIFFVSGSTAAATTFTHTGTQCAVTIMHAHAQGHLNSHHRHVQLPSSSCTL